VNRPWQRVDKKRGASVAQLSLEFGSGTEMLQNMLHYP